MYCFVHPSCSFPAFIVLSSLKLVTYKDAKHPFVYVGLGDNFTIQLLKEYSRSMTSKMLNSLTVDSGEYTNTATPYEGMKICETYGYES